MTSRCLRLFAACVLLIPFLASCQKTEKIVVDEQRELTVFDLERDPLVAVMPPEWRRIPGTQFRIYNYLFGQDGEVFLGRARGSVLANVNRWLGQVGEEPISNLDDLEKVEVLGQEGVLVHVSGDFAGGMGRPPRKNAGLAGMIVQAGDGLLTIKMVGDADAVTAEQERLIQFAKSLRMRSADTAEKK